MSNQPFDTNNSWDALLRFLNLVVFIVVCIIIYIPSKPSIDRYLNRPKYDKEQLRKLTLERSRGLSDDWDKVEKGIHVKTGMVYDSNFKHIQSHCLSCHSSKLITQNRADRNGWKSMIRWMQKTQGLHDLSDSEPKILDYLSKHYAPKEVGRRPNIDMKEVEWYLLQG
jgi:hypothetical protein